VRAGKQWPGSGRTGRLSASINTSSALSPPPPPPPRRPPPAAPRPLRRRRLPPPTTIRRLGLLAPSLPFPPRLPPPQPIPRSCRLASRRQSCLPGSARTEFFSGLAGWLGGVLVVWCFGVLVLWCVGVSGVSFWCGCWGVVLLLSGLLWTPLLG
jgi:hypothetical protein